LLCHTKIHIKFEFGFDPLIFHKVMAHGLRKISQIISFPHLLSLLTDIHLIFGTCTLLCHTKIQIKFEFAFDPLIFTKLWTLDLEKISRIFCTFFSLLTDIHFIFGTLFCNTKLQIKFKFGFNPLEFHELWPMDLEKYHALSVVCTFIVLPTGFKVSDS
jgi:hypothetical protein